MLWFDAGGLRKGINNIDTKIGSLVKLYVRTDLGLQFILALFVSLHEYSQIESYQENIFSFSRSFYFAERHVYME